MARKKGNTLEADAPVDPETLARALASAVASGDIVNLRLLFMSFSPARTSSGENFGDEKYAYLFHGESADAFDEALALVKAPENWDHCMRELEAKRPPQLPGQLVLKLADNALRLEKLGAAAQAYELLRMRRSMQDAVLDEADRALNSGDIEAGVTGYLLGAGLAYDYAAFPEPLPMVPDYPTKALILHATYPRTPEESVALQPDEQRVGTALDYLLYDGESAGRLHGRGMDARLAFLDALVRRIDPAWEAFLSRFEETCRLMAQFGDRAQRAGADSETESLADEVQEQRLPEPAQLMETLLGRRIENGAWWQYLKELASQHPAAVLFVARQLVGEDEVLVPRLLGGSQVSRQLGLEAAAGVST
jgi:hypothetical protein